MINTLIKESYGKIYKENYSDSLIRVECLKQKD